MRIFSIFAVVVLHIASNEGVSYTSSEWWTLNTFESLVRWPVPVFVMISGALFLDKERSIKMILKHNIKRIAVALVFWSVFYAIWDFIVIKRTNSVKEMIGAVISGHYHLWYLYMLIGLYFLIPFLHSFVEKGIYKYYIILAFVFAYLLPWLINIVRLKYDSFATVLDSVVNNFHLDFLLGYTCYFCLGYFFNKIDIHRSHRFVLYILGITGIIITAVLTAIASNKEGVTTQVFYRNFNVNTFFVAVAVFVLTKQLFGNVVPDLKSEKVLNYCSKCTFGVYLIHPIFIDLVKIINIDSYINNAAISVVVYSIIVFILSFVLSALLNKLPLVNKSIV